MLTRGFKNSNFIVLAGSGVVVNKPCSKRNMSPRERLVFPIAASAEHLWCALFHGLFSQLDTYNIWNHD